MSLHIYVWDMNVDFYILDDLWPNTIVLSLVFYIPIRSCFTGGVNVFFLILNDLLLKALIFF